MDTTGFPGTLVSSRRVDSVSEDTIPRIDNSNDTTGASTRIDTDSEFDWATIKGRQNSLTAVVHCDGKVGNIGRMTIVAVWESACCDVGVTNCSDPSKARKLLEIADIPSTLTQLKNDTYWSQS